tara:strand:+ start:1970 stop:3541 length:1572 start_codon:yes stop_codon:yes gene_type:complete
MSDIIIYNGRKKPLNSKLLELLKSDGISYLTVESIEDLITNMSNQEFKSVHICLNEVFPTRILETITKSKIYSFNRGLSITVQFSHYYFSEFNRAVISGANWIIVDPIETSDLFRSIKGSVEKILPPVKEKDFMGGITPIICKISVFARAGKIHKEPLGNMHIETNLNLQIGDKVKINSLFKLNTEQDQHVFVKEKVEEDNYYNYNYSYTLTSIPFFEESYDETILNEKENRIKNWITKSKNDLVIPKTKCLFIGNKLPKEIEDSIEKNIFSLYQVTKDNLDGITLNRINPKIIYFESEDKSIQKLVNDWVENKNDPVNNKNVFFIRGYESESSDMPYLPLIEKEMFPKNFLNLLEPFLRERVETSLEKFYYINRKSVISKCNLELSGFVLDTTGYLILILSPSDVFPGTIILVEGAGSTKEENFKIFIKVIYSKKSEDSLNYNLYGQILPLTEKMNRIFFPSEKDKEEIFSKKWVQKYEKSSLSTNKIKNKNSLYIVLNKLILALILLIFVLMFILIITRKA